ncbi:hypothetical protein KL933_004554 [Ogataea haglerorum]|uniref:Peroxin/Ferlin domain-containing protein n=1 Tax=Ogataea haglerorum TaxID=1937702 RepID=A0AAN6D2J6_9ASCO|nr:uncharacterized protein KL911_004569 [Ogataea haglerorum]KAG7724732.1 hypothetical protein KL933_004554 [Ogataea haglerorum]KAG7751695.1 hypothetical protein KL911_004569 [Ogataea haglerorum]
MSEPNIRASFADNRRPLSKTKGQLLKMPPVITSALYTAFPFIYILDKVLAFLTWTNDDPYTNFIVIAIYITVVKYWTVVACTVLPTIIALGTCAMLWFLKTTIEDLRSEAAPPTIEEIIDTLINMQARFSYFVEPFSYFGSLSGSDYFNIGFSLIAITPCYIWLMTRIFTVRSFLLVFGVIWLSFHSSWSVATRHLLWRSIVIRKILTFATGLKFSLVDKNIELTVLNDFQISNVGTGKIVEIHILQNQRRWLGVGWSNTLLPFERGPFTTENLEKSWNSLESFQLREITQAACRWRWLDANWKTDNSFAPGEGWIYYNNSWKDPSTKDSLTSFTRTKRWIRRALVIVEDDETA